MSATIEPSTITTLECTLRLGVLDRSAIDRITHALAHRAGSTRLICRTVRHGTEFGAPTVTELAAQVCGSVSPGDPTRWDNLLLQASSHAPGTRRMAAVEAASGRVTVRVTSDDAVWVHGMLAQLRDLLIGFGARATPARRIPIGWTPWRCAMAGAAGGALVVAAVAGPLERPAAVDLSIVAAGLLALTGFLTGRRIAHRGTTLLYPAGDPPPRSGPRPVEVISLVLSGLGTVATLVAAVASGWS